MSNAAKQKVMEATWDWRSDRNGQPGTGDENLRRQALTQTVVMILVAAFLYFILDHTFFVPIILALAAIVLILGMAFPAAYRPVHGFGRWLSRVVGKGLTYLLLVPFFFLFFTPVALILRAQGRDPLHRGFRDTQWTYWIRRGPKEPAENIDKQFLRENKEAREELRAVGTVSEPKGTDRS